MPGARRGFSLIELLVTLAIIVVLAGLLLPAVGMVRGSAQATRCQSALRQIGIAGIAYSGDHDGFLVYAYGYGNDPWTVRLADYCDAWSNDGSIADPAYLSRSSVMWGCPVANHAATLTGFMTGYGMTVHPASHAATTTPWTPGIDDAHNAWPGRIGGWGWGPFREFTLSSITWPGQRLCIADALQDPAITLEGWQIFSESYVVCRHRGAAAGVFFDGHIGMLNQAQAHAAIFNPGASP